MLKLRHELALGAAALALAAPAAAQSAQPDPARPTNQEILADSQQPREEANDASAPQDIIVVTARRRAERLLDVPISVTSLSGQQLQDQGVQDLTELSQTVPNVTLEVSRGTNTTLTAFIRGVGQQDPVAGFEQGVGVYVDDVYLNRPQAAVLDVYDVERIEVLRGPQGTLYGRNTIGGAIKYVTRRLPTDMEFKARGTYGSYDQADLVLTGSVPLTDTIRLGASGARLSRGGFGDNLVQDGVENYNKDLWAARATLEAEAGDAIFIRLSGDYVKDNSDPRQGHRLIPGLVSGAPVLDDEFDTRAGLSNIQQEVEAYGGALTVEADVSSALKLRNILAYREDSSTTPIDFDSLPAADVDVPAIYNNDQFSEEFQLLYDDGTLAGLIGAYYLRANALTIFDTLLDTTGQIIGVPGLNAQTFGDVDTETVAIFGDFTYDLTERLSLSVGGRYTWDTRESVVRRQSLAGGFSDYFGGNGVPFAVTSDFTGKETFKEFTPRVSLSYQPNENHNFYATYSKGFKGGGFDPRGQTTLAPDLDGDGTVSDEEVFDFIRFAPEKVDSYELGWKASLLDNRLSFNLAGFYADYTDVQIPGSVGADTNGDGINDTFAGVTTNAGAATIKGIELESTIRAGRDFAGDGSTFDVGLSFGYIDAEYDQFIDAFGNDVADQRVFQNTPDYTASVRGDLGVPVGGGMLMLGSQAALRSDTSQFEQPNRFLDQDGYVLIDANISWISPDEMFRIGVYGKNLTDERYLVSGYNFVNAPYGGPITSTLGQEGTLTGFYGDPRRVFVTGEIRF
ncbi:TonB-dependent receptor [Pacificimonas flava]|uniref:TonB-dependent receptor n=1 Tax=Pacificimonas flava TaxID=1234595 RepID=M2TBD3_9SPHN|nr:TonB-dependent receptor [Pacificimonas flava]EMD83919.1 TonB-dependent receptor [Pacificimonas flava]MBB5281108.1 iron complex outermembrane receptor protein [Pacificimonas flava]